MWAWLLRRLSPHAYLGLHLTLSAAVLIGTIWLFGGITEDVLHGAALTVVDCLYIAVAQLDLERARTAVEQTRGAVAGHHLRH